RAPRRDGPRGPGDPAGLLSRASGPYGQGPGKPASGLAERSGAPARSDVRAIGRSDPRISERAHTQAARSLIRRISPAAWSPLTTASSKSFLAPFQSGPGMMAGEPTGHGTIGTIPAIMKPPPGEPGWGPSCRSEA